MKPVRFRGAESGIALVLVLIVLSLLLAIAGEFALAMRTESTTTLNFRAAVTAAALAEAAYHRALAEILAEPLAATGGERGHLVQLDERSLLVFRRAAVETVVTPERGELRLGPGRFSYRISDEQARLNLNRAAPDVLHRLLTELGVERTARDVIVDSVLDWRDQNEEYRLNGAESDYYLGLPTPHRSKNADLDSVDELAQIRGVTKELLYGRPESPGLAEYVTVVPGLAAVNVNTASVLVLRALGLAQAEAELLVAGRPFLARAAVRPTPRGAWAVRSETFRIEAVGEVPGQGRRTLTAIVQRRVKDGAPQVLPLGWRWNLDEAEPPA